MSVADDLATRRTVLRDRLALSAAKYLASARLNYFGQQILIWGSLLLSGAAAVTGLWPSNIPKEVVGALAAASAGLVGASRQLGLQQKANWHYRKVDALIALQRRLEFELPLPPTPDDLAAISSAWSALDADMSRQWEDLQSAPPKSKG